MIKIIIDLSRRDFLTCCRLKRLWRLELWIGLYVAKNLLNLKKTLKYYHDLIVYDIKTHKIINWYDFGSDLIQSVVLIDENMISVSSGLNSYIVTV